ncbi:AbrB/MazE/SpoVT family DNA-binding domain-containing protein [Shouchella clausii]|uniref:AbrB/MazE/SpoVT family DNA-binding domain-containing protein n=1 Tax=Shouchella clausii TaxID=79880 RepID=UPI000794415F|nr:AbrB/MazE/SpoVT family DNA-binding domain-containing protein [Shouchella clausii]KKI85113.1 hypothetical protein WZ76_16795 [Shouchella clausii]
MDIDKHKGGLVMTVALKQWGNSLAIRIPSNVSKSLNLKEGSELELILEKDVLILKPKRKKFTLDYAIQEMEKQSPPKPVFDDSNEGDELF